MINSRLYLRNTPRTIRSIPKMSTSHGTSKFQNLPRAISGPVECPLEVRDTYTSIQSCNKVIDPARERISYIHLHSTKALHFPMRNVGCSNFMAYFLRISRRWMSRSGGHMSSTAVGRIIWLRIHLWRVWRCRARCCIIEYAHSSSVYSNKMLTWWCSCCKIISRRCLVWSTHQLKGMLYRITPGCFGGRRAAFWISPIRIELKNVCRILAAAKVLIISSLVTVKR